MSEDPQQKPPAERVARSAVDVISPDEVAALLDGVHAGKVSTDAGRAVDGAVEPYDFAAGEHIIRGRLAVLDLIDERFARGLRGSLERLVYRQIDVRCQPAQRQRFAQALGAATGPVAIFVVNLRSLGCPGLLILDAGLVAALTDAFYGGTGRDQRHEASADLTPGEWRLARKCFDACLVELHAAWSAVVPLDAEFVRAESDPQFAAIVAASAPTLVRKYRVTLESSGEIALLLPMSGLEAIREQLQAGGVVRSEPEWRPALEAALRDSVLELETVFSRVDITVRALTSLKAGDILEIERPDTVLVLADGQPVFSARYGTSSGHNAVQVVGPVRRASTVRNSQKRRSA